jgi:glyoxylase-like metal-dependent hydrolase (beta-lactamase superfamily II)
MQIIHFFDPATWTLTYIVYDNDTKDAVVIDPVLDFDPKAVDVSDTSAHQVAAKVKELGLNVHYIIDTHAHADHLSGQHALKELIGGKTAIGKEITAVQEVFKGIFNFGDEFPTDGSQWDELFADGEPVKAGSLTIEPIHSPGHTPACYAYKIRDAVFTGDVLFMPDFGTGRCDFPGGSSEDLYDSVQRLYAMPDATRVFVGHDYQPGGRELKFETTVGESKVSNKHLKATDSKEDFVKFRSERDATLRPPNLIFQSLQVNAQAGVLPDADTNGLRYLKLPMGVFA